MVAMVNASSTSSVEHCLDVLPGVQTRLSVKLHGRRVDSCCRDDQLQMTTPRVEVSGVRVIVNSRRRRVGRRPVIVEYELVGREERVAVAAADTLGSRAACNTQQRLKALAHVRST